MTGFAFPPPPPPPPKAAAQDSSSGTSYPSQSGGYGQRSARGGGDRGRGRGRGRGGYARGGNQNSYAPVTGHGQPQAAQQFIPPTLPTGGYINPAFAAYNAATQQQWNSQVYPNVANPSSYSSQPWSAQAPSMPMNTSYTSGKHYSGPPHPSSRGRGSHNALFQKPASKPKTQTAPSIPSFGFALPTAQPDAPISDVNDVGHKNKKRKFNQLGLTPRSEVHEDSEEEIDEEAKVAANGGVLQFEYRGRSSTLKTPAEIAAWIEERKKRFPTKARVEEKMKQEEEAREAKRRAQEQAEAERKAKYGKDKDDGKNKKVMDKVEKLRRKLAKAEEKAAKAAQKSEKSDNAEMNGKANTETVPSAANTSKIDLGINYESDEDEDVASDAEFSVVSTSSEEPSSDSDSGDLSSDSEEESDSDAPPDEEPSAKRPIRVEPPKRKSVLQQRPSRNARKEPPPKRTMSLHDRLVEQERRKEAELALQAIKFLGENGFFKR